MEAHLGHGFLVLFRYIFGIYRILHMHHILINIRYIPIKSRNILFGITDYYPVYTNNYYH